MEFTADQWAARRASDERGAGPAIRVGKFGSTFEWTPERGWRVTPPSGLVLPPWDLCGFDRDFDPYTAERFGPVGWYGYQLEREAERAVADPNAADGRWPELAFMPHWVAWPVVEMWKDAEHLRSAGVRSDRSVPQYLSVPEALVREQVLREERRQIAGS